MYDIYHLIPHFCEAIYAWCLLCLATPFCEFLTEEIAEKMSSFDPTMRVGINLFTCDRCCYLRGVPSFIEMADNLSSAASCWLQQVIMQFFVHIRFVILLEALTGL